MRKRVERDGAGREGREGHRGRAAWTTELGAGAKGQEQGSAVQLGLQRLR